MKTTKEEISVTFWFCFPPISTLNFAFLSFHIRVVEKCATKVSIHRELRTHEREAKKLKEFLIFFVVDVVMSEQEEAIRMEK